MAVHNTSSLPFCTLFFQILLLNINIAASQWRQTFFPIFILWIVHLDRWQETLRPYFYLHHGELTRDFVAR